MNDVIYREIVQPGQCVQVHAVRFIRAEHINAAVVEFWYQHSDDVPLTEVQIVGTGQPFDGASWVASTGREPHTGLVWHLVQRPPMERPGAGGFGG